MPIENGPREKLISEGADSLSTPELIAILLRTGTKDTNVLVLSDELFNAFGKSLYKMSRVTLGEFKKIKGLGNVKAVTLLAALELAKRLVREEVSILDEPVFNSPENVFKYCMDMQTFRQEVARVLFLDTKLKLVGSKDISKGTLNISVVHPRDIFREALLRNCSGIVLVHNHPSGDVKPSNEDLELTIRLKKTGDLLGITLLDHVIIGNTFYSFRQDCKEVGWNND
ncbi:MAG: DNA repair protein RadC [Fervidobacterium sp.]